MPAPISITWMALTLAILLYTFWDAPRWYKTPVHSVVISAITYGPVHFITAQWSPAAETLLFVVACGLWATFLHYMVRYTLWDLPPYVPKQRTTQAKVDPQIAAAYQKLGIDQPGESPQPATYTPPPTVVEVIEEPLFTNEDDWEIFTPTGQTFSTNGVH